MKLWKKSIAVVVAMMMVLMAIPALNVQAGDAGEIGVRVNGEWVRFADQQPIMVNGTVLVPVAGVFEAAGFLPQWNARTRTAVLVGEYFNVVIPADGTTIYIGKDLVITPEVPQRIVNNRLMLPLRALAEALDGTAEWIPSADGFSGRAEITLPWFGAEIDPGYNVDPVNGDDDDCDDPDCDHDYNGEEECDDPDCDHYYNGDDCEDEDCDEDDEDCDDEDKYVHVCDEYCDEDCAYAYVHECDEYCDEDCEYAVDCEEEDE